MASLRNKKYAERADAPPVSTPPTTAADPPRVEPTPSPELPPNESAADRAAKDAIALQLRLREMERAEQLNREAVQQPPPQAAEPPQQQPAMPAHVQQWLAEHPEYCDRNDQIAQAEIYTATLKCNRDGKSLDHPDFIPTLERHLGLAPRINGQTQHRPSPAPAAAPRYESPPVRQQRSAVPYSAPPTREVPSMSTGRPSGRQAPLTRDEVEVALASKVHAGESDEAAVRRYQYNKQKMQEMRARGELDDRR